MLPVYFETVADVVSLTVCHRKCCCCGCVNVLNATKNASERTENPFEDTSPTSERQAYAVSHG